MCCFRERWDEHGTKGERGGGEGDEGKTRRGRGGSEKRGERGGRDYGGREGWEGRGERRGEGRGVWEGGVGGGGEAGAGKRENGYVDTVLGIGHVDIRVHAFIWTLMVHGEAMEPCARSLFEKERQNERQEQQALRQAAEVALATPGAVARRVGWRLRGWSRGDEEVVKGELSHCLPHPSHKRLLLFLSPPPLHYPSPLPTCSSHANVCPTDGFLPLQRCYTAHRRAVPSSLLPTSLNPFPALPPALHRTCFSCIEFCASLTAPHLLPSHPFVLHRLSRSPPPPLGAGALCNQTRQRLRRCVRGCMQSWAAGCSVGVVVEGRAEGGGGAVYVCVGGSGLLDSCGLLVGHGVVRLGGAAGCLTDSKGRRRGVVGEVRVSYTCCNGRSLVWLHARLGERGGMLGGVYLEQRLGGAGCRVAVLFLGEEQRKAEVGGGKGMG
ncbi:unnamed protein product [Closterium sp. NIES-64]|nr:unnamed protein product [Closterium sp. NIES-64]